MFDSAAVRLLLLAALGASAACAERPLRLDWPADAFSQYRMAYIGASLVPVVPSAEEPTANAMAARSPFVHGESRVAVDLDALAPALAAAYEAAASGAGEARE